MASHVSETLAAELAVREQAPLLNEPIMAAIPSLDRSLTQSSRLTSILGEVLERQCHFQAHPTSHRMTETDPFAGKSTFKEEDFSALDTAYNCLTNSRSCCSSDTNDEGRPKRERASDFCGAFPFH